jgi:hypothetical protein
MAVTNLTQKFHRDEFWDMMPCNIVGYLRFGTKSSASIFTMTYKEQSIVSGTGTAIWSKALGLLATITLEAVPFRDYAPFPERLPFQCILEVVFCDST